MNSKVKTADDTAVFVRMVADKQGWFPNPDEEFRSIIERGLTENYNRYGYFLCPCRDGEGKREFDADIVCPCEYARADIEEYGRCFCGLFVSPPFAETGAVTSSIPERRPENLRDR